MANRPSMCLIVLFAVVGKFDVVVSDTQTIDPSIILPMPIPVTTEPSTLPPIATPTEPIPAGNGPIQDSKICPCGFWYAVMATEVSSNAVVATEVSGNGPCNIFTNNKYPCCCTTMIIRKLHDSDWDISGSSENIETSELTVHTGGATSETQENKEINGFIVSQASIPASIVDLPCKITIAQNVDGSPAFLKYHLTIIDWNAKNGYMITQVKTDNAPDPFTIIWCHNSHPGKMTIWTSILDDLKQLNIDPHSMSFIKQDNCTYPTAFQYDEMSFC